MTHRLVSWTVVGVSAHNTRTHRHDADLNPLSAIRPNERGVGQCRLGDDSTEEQE